MDKIISICLTISFLGFLLMLSYCGKLDTETNTALEKYYTDNGQTQMDISCSRLRGENIAAQSVACVTYFQNKP